ncbi:MAG: alpha/beta hydrolase [Alphaproteobacteria bacterium]
MAMEGDIRAVDAGDGVELHYEVLGAGPPVVMLHGSLVGRKAFSRQREALAAKYTLILPSSRGHDGTELTLPPDYGFETSEFRDLRAVLDAEGLERTHLIGHSSGGSTAFAFARDCPERVNRLVLIEPSLINLVPEAPLRVLAAETDRIIDAGERHGDLAALRVYLDDQGGNRWHALDEATKAKRLDAMAPMAPLMIPHWRILMSFKATPEDLKGLQPPTLLFYGTKSLKWEQHIAAAWRDARPDLPLITLEGAGHNVHHDCADIVNPAILDFLA